MVYREIEKVIRDLLIANVDLQNYFKSFFGVDTIDLQGKIRIGHVNTIEDPIYPLVTFYITGGGMNDNQFSVSPKLHINVWSKEKIDTSQEIYGIIRSAINLKPISGANIAQVKERSYEDNLFEKSTQVYHVSTWYEVTAVNT